MAVVDDLRPTSPKQLQSSEDFKVPNLKGLLSSIIQYILYLSNQS
jgi:hypothetical protein